jgi:hypothetical protein
MGAATKVVHRGFAVTESLAVRGIPVTREVDPAEGYHPRYGANIDGLRAIAVLAVFLYHFWGRMLPGGFLSIDVFFVISSFLITRILARENEAGIRPLALLCDSMRCSLRINGKAVYFDDNRLSAFVMPAFERLFAAALDKAGRPSKRVD